MADQDTDLTKDLGTELPAVGAEHDPSKDSEKKDDSAQGSILSTGEDASTSESLAPKASDKEGAATDATAPSAAPSVAGDVSVNTALPEGDVKDGSDEKKDGALSEASAPSASESAPSAPLASSDAAPAATEATSTSMTADDSAKSPATAGQATDASKSGAGASSQETVAPSASIPASDDKGARAAEKGEDDDGTPKLAEPQPEAQPIVDIAPDLADVLKEVGNKLTGALKKLGNYEDKFQKLESEAKARFDHVRQKATEVVAGLEAWFKRS